MLHVFGVGQDQVKGARRGLRNQSQHVVAAGVVLGFDLDPELALEVTDDVLLGMPGPGQNDQLFFRGGKASQGQDASQGRAACQNACGFEKCPS
ncbi:hypothetical protein FQZ97_1253380 [compost metagenome]